MLLLKYDLVVYETHWMYLYFFTYLSAFQKYLYLLKVLIKFYDFHLEYLYLYLTKFQSTCTLLKYFQMYLVPCLVHTYLM